MGWPTPQDYNEAIQNPKTCFSDPELRQGTPALTPLGLPKPITGAFASVYQLNCPNRRWAVRCFQREFADQERRYAAISDRLKAAKLPCMVGFEFLPQGILIRGQWYPILKMEWIDGDPINDYLSRNRNDRQVLQSLSRHWIGLMGSLRKAQIAHGDLQHGNILVSGGNLKLIDYDAMYVPALAGLSSHEEGHRNYQHPGRTGRDYHPDLDNFSAWVIFISISALAIDPRVWNLLNAGDECLLFRREDFEKPRTSKALQVLESSGNLQLQTLASYFRSVLNAPLSKVPSLNGLVQDQPTEPKESESDQAVEQGLPSWLRDHVGQENLKDAPKPIEAKGHPTAINNAEWLFDHLIDDKPPTRPLPLQIKLRDRITLWMCIGFTGLMIAAWVTTVMSGWVSIFLVTLAFVACDSFLFLGYSKTNQAIQKLKIRHHLKNVRKWLAHVENQIKMTKRDLGQLGEPAATVKSAYMLLPTKLDEEYSQANRTLAKTLEVIERHKRKIQTDEAAALRQSEKQFQSIIGQLTRMMNSLDSDEQADFYRLSKQLKNEHVYQSLISARIMDSTVPGVGEKLAGRLSAAGIYTAFDISYNSVRNVPGIGEAKASALLDWREMIELNAISLAPTSLSQAELDQIRNTYLSQRQSIKQKLASSTEGERKSRQEILEQFTSARQILNTEAAAAKRDHKVERSDMRSRYDAERAMLTVEYKALRARVQEEQKKLEAKLDELDRNLFQGRLEARQVERELAQYKGITPINYIQQTFMRPRST